MADTIPTFSTTDNELDNLQNVLGPRCGLNLWLEFGKRGPAQVFLRPNHHYRYLRQLLNLLQPAEREVEFMFTFRDGYNPDMWGRYEERGVGPSTMTCTVSDVATGKLANVRWSQGDGKRPKGFDEYWMGDADLYDVGTREMWTVAQFPKLACERVEALKSKIKVFVENKMAESSDWQNPKSTPIQAALGYAKTYKGVQGKLTATSVTRISPMNIKGFPAILVVLQDAAKRVYPVRVAKVNTSPPGQKEVFRWTASTGTLPIKPAAAPTAIKPAAAPTVVKKPTAAPTPIKPAAAPTVVKKPTAAPTPIKPAAAPTARPVPLPPIGPRPVSSSPLSIHPTPAWKKAATAGEAGRGYVMDTQKTSGDLKATAADTSSLAPAGTQQSRVVVTDTVTGTKYAVRVWKKVDAAAWNANLIIAGTTTPAAVPSPAAKTPSPAAVPSPAAPSPSALAIHPTPTWKKAANKAVEAGRGYVMDTQKTSGDLKATAADTSSLAPAGTQQSRVVVTDTVTGTKYAVRVWRKDDAAAWNANLITAVPSPAAANSSPASVPSAAKNPAVAKTPSPASVPSAAKNPAVAKTPSPAFVPSTAKTPSPAFVPSTAKTPSPGTAIKGTQRTLNVDLAIPDVKNVSKNWGYATMLAAYGVDNWVQFLSGGTTYRLKFNGASKDTNGLIRNATIEKWTTSGTWQALADADGLAGTASNVNVTGVPIGSAPLATSVKKLYLASSSRTWTLAGEQAAMSNNDEIISAYADGRAMQFAARGGSVFRAVFKGTAVQLFRQTNPGWELVAGPDWLDPLNASAANFTDGENTIIVLDVTDEPDINIPISAVIAKRADPKAGTRFTLALSRWANDDVVVDIKAESYAAFFYAYPIGSWAHFVADSEIYRARLTPETDLAFRVLTIHKAIQGKSLVRANGNYVHMFAPLATSDALPMTFTIMNPSADSAPSLDPAPAPGPSPAPVPAPSGSAPAPGPATPAVPRIYPTGGLPVTLTFESHQLITDSGDFQAVRPYLAAGEWVQFATQRGTMFRMKNSDDYVAPVDSYDIAYTSIELQVATTADSVDPPIAYGFVTIESSAGMTTRGLPAAEPAKVRLMHPTDRVPRWTDVEIDDIATPTDTAPAQAPASQIDSAPGPAPAGGPASAPGPAPAPADQMDWGDAWDSPSGPPKAPGPAGGYRPGMQPGFNDYDDLPDSAGSGGGPAPAPRSKSALSWWMWTIIGVLAAGLLAFLAYRWYKARQAGVDSVDNSIPAGNNFNDNYFDSVGDLGPNPAVPGPR